MTNAKRNELIRAGLKSSIEAQIAKNGRAEVRAKASMVRALASKNGWQVVNQGLGAYSVFK